MKQAKNGGARMAKSLLTGLGVGLLLMAAGCVLTAVLVSNQKLPEGAIRYCAWAICALSAITCCMTAQRLAGKGSLPVSLCSAILLTLCMILLRLAAAEGGEWSWYGVIILGAAALAAAFIRAGGKNRRR